MREDMIYADPQYRTKMTRMILVFGGVGLLVIILLATFLKDSVLVMRPAEAVRIIRPILTVIVLMPILIGMFLFYYGVRCLRDGRFPHQNVKVLKDTKIYYDIPAIKRSVLILLLAAMIIILSSFAAIIVNQFLNTLLA